MGEHDSGDSTPQFSAQTQLRYHTRERERSDELDLEEYSSKATVDSKIECILITRIRATDITIRMRWIPAGFYVRVKSENVTKRTSNRPVSVGKDVVEWDDKIVLPADRSSRVSFTLFASFELGPTLGDGEALRTFETTIDELLGRDGWVDPIKIFEHSDGGANFLPASLEIESERRVCGRNEYVAASNPPESEEMSCLEELTHNGHRALARYRECVQQRDIDESIRHLEQARDLCPPDHPSHAAVLFNLATTKLIHRRVNGVSPDLDVAIDLYRAVLRLRPRGHPDHPLTLLSLGIALQARFQRKRNKEDGEEGRTLLSQVKDVAPADSYAYHAAVLALGSTAEHQLRQPTEYPQGIEYYFEDDGRIERLDAALQRMFYPDSSRPALLDHLGILFCIRFEWLGDLADCEKVVSMVEVVVQSTSDTHPDRPFWLGDLGCLLLTCYQRSGDVVHLERSISVLEGAVRFTPDGHSAKLVQLNNFAHSLSLRYMCLGDLVDLEKSTSIREDLVKFTPDGDPDKPSRLYNLGSSFSHRYMRFGDVIDLGKSISMFEDAVRFTPDGQPDKLLRLSNLSFSLLVRYMRFGDTADLEKSISIREDVLKLTPDSHPDKPSSLNNLGESLATRYKRFGDIIDLEKSIRLLKDAVQFTPDGHPNKPPWFNNLGEALLTRYQRSGDVVDLEKSISTFEDAVRFTPDGRPNKLVMLHNLAQSLSERYIRFGGLVDLDKSISMRDDLVKFTPDDHPDKPLRLNNLGNSLLTRYERSGDVVDLEKSISMLEGAMQFTPDGHPNKLVWLNNLAHSLSERHKRFGDRVDLERSILMAENVVKSTPDDYPRKPSYLVFLALSLLRRFFQHSRDPASSDVHQATLHFSHAARSRTGPSLDRFRAAQHWTQCLCLLQRDSQSVLDACAVVVDLLPQLAWIGSSLHDRYHQLLQAADEVRISAATALKANRPELAVEWLEQGRSIMWSQLSQLRTPVDDIRTAYPELATQFERVSHELEHASSRDRAAVNESTNHSDTAGGLLEKQARQHHTLALERESLLAEIRALPGFERFLLPKTIHQLSSLAHSGPVVFLNASRAGCDALVVKAGSERVIHVPLSNITYDDVAGMQLQLSKVLRLNGRVILRDNSDRGARLRGMGPDDVFKTILPCLWEKVVSPILEVLAFSTSGPKLPRIFWCPTGPFTFLPIHAAGICDEANQGPKLSDFVISSYIPTMSALELPRQGDAEGTSRNTRLLAVRQPSTDGHVHLTGVPREMEILRNLTSSSPFVDLQEANGTVEDVLAKMRKTDWVHFACHATQDRRIAFDSGLLLADGKRLKLSDIAQLSRPRGGLAFLSACQTATGDEQLSEEAIHIAAGMLLAGYRGVIATMWSIMDSDAPRVAEDVYNRLFHDGKVPDSGQAAEALHDAIERLRESGVSFLSWVPFIHVGV